MKPVKKVSLYVLIFIGVVGTIFVSSIVLKKDLSYNKYTPTDVYKYGGYNRSFNWLKVRQYIDTIETLSNRYCVFGVLDNYKNLNGISPLTQNPQKDKFGATVDLFGVEQSQAIPLYKNAGDDKPYRYARDGSLVEIGESVDSLDQYALKVVSMDDTCWYYAPKKYVETIGPVEFKKIIFVDVKDQNISTVEKCDTAWCVKSMTYATTGLELPPYKRRTPEGVYVVVGKLPNMLFPIDGSDQIGGFAPYASRFTGGAYIHGVPVNYPSHDIVEYSPTLGTTPRSHRCVRTVTSNAQYIYSWANVLETLVVVFE